LNTIKTKIFEGRQDTIGKREVKERNKRRRKIKAKEIRVEDVRERVRGSKRERMVTGLRHSHYVKKLTVTDNIYINN
jgi:hypothetical protein